MAIVWGAWKTGGSGSTYNEIRIGLDISWSSVAWNSSSTVATVTLYTENKYRFNNTQTATWTGSLSGSFSFSNTQGAGDVSSRGTTYYTHNYGSNPATFTFGANLSTYIGTATVSVSTTTPTRPAGVVPTMGTLSLSAGIRYIDLSWGLAATGSTGVDRYDIYRNGSYWTTTYGQDNRSIRDTVGNGVTNNYTVYAHNEVGWSGASNTPSATTPSLPSTPGSFTANANTFGQIGLSWTASSGSGYTPTYYITRSPGTYAQNTTATSITDTTVAPYTEYTYSIFARTSVGDSSTTTVTARSMGGIGKVWNGTTNVVVLPKVWNGTQWVDAQARMWNGTEWKHGI